MPSWTALIWEWDGVFNELYKHAMLMTKYRLLAALLFIAAGSAKADAVYQAPDAFVQQAFESAAPQLQTLWLDQELKQGAKNILKHPFAPMRVRYWREGDRSAWILDEIGKERPITLGVVVDNNTIAQVKVLTYRESRGGEVRHAFFTNQFIGAMLNDKRQLDRGIDGVTGATMSVRAVTRVAQLALLFHQHVNASATQVAQQ